MAAASLLAIAAFVGEPAFGQVGRRSLGCFSRDTGEPVSCENPPEASEDSDAPTVHIIELPPVIIWHHPSAEGSQMPGLSTTVDARMVNQLNAIADTPVTLRSKGEFAMEHGDYATARAYFEAARQRDPGNAELQQDEARLSALFDQGTTSVGVPKFQKTDELAPTPLTAFAKYKNNPKIMELRREEMKAYAQVAMANEDLHKAESGPPGDVAKAQAKLAEAAKAFQKAQAALKKKIYVLDK